MSNSEKLPKFTPPLVQIIELLVALKESGFWGEVTIKFKNGLPIAVTKHEQIKVGQE